MSASSKTTDHDEIRKWVEARGGRPSIVRTGGGKGKNKSGGVLRIDFGPKEDNLEEVTWDEFFAVFDQSHISFLHQDQTKDGKESRFSRFVEASPEDEKASGKKGDKKSDSSKKSAAKASSAKSGEKKSATKAKSAEKSATKAKSSGKAETKAAAKSETKSSGKKGAAKSAGGKSGSKAAKSKG
jgi:hypothetical protein